MRKNLLATLLACLALGGATLHATTLYWSGDGTTQGGPGTWNTTLARWGTSTSGPFTTVWNNANTDSAIIDNGTGAGGSIVIGAAITMRGTLTLNGSGGTYPAYTINGASAMTFAAGSTLTTAMNRIMSCPYSGTITKAGAGTVTFNNSNGSVTKFILTAGTADFASPNRMPGTDVSDFITLNGGKLRGSTVAWGSFGKSITVGASGGTIFGSSSSVAMTADKPITSTGSGRLTIDNSAFTLSNTNNNWAGPMTVSSGILTLGAAGVIPDTCAVTLSGGDLATGGFAETIDTLIVTSSGSAITGVGPLTVNTLIDLRASSTIGTTVIAGAASATKTTTGMATLTGANTYSGGTALSAGVLRVGNNSALGTGKLTITGGRLSGNSSTARTLSVPVDLNGNVTLGTNTVDTGNLTFQTGAWTITGATRTITTDTNTISINSAIGEDAPGRGLIKAGAIGILALNSPANTYSGDTTISAGTINVDADGSFGNGAGAINLAGGNIGVTADRGVSSANIINPVNMTANAEIMAATTTGTRNIVFGGVWTTTAGTLTLHSTQVTVGPATFNVRFTNAFTFSQPITFVADNAGNFVNLDVWNRADLGDQTYNGLISGPGSIKRSISTAGTGGKVTFTQQNTYSGGTSLNDGEIALGSDCTGSANAPTAGPLGTGTVTIGNDVGRLSASAASRNLFNRVLFSATGTHLALLGSNDLELSGNVDLAGQSVTITNLNTGVARISGVIGNGALIKDGAGTLVLSGANTYAGTTTVSAGLLDAAAAGSLGTNSVNVASGATLQLDAVGAIGSSANLVLGSGALPVNLNFAGVSNIRALSFDGGATFQDAGTWGATGSGATHIDDAHFAGAGQLSVALAGSITSLATDGSPSTYGNTVTFTATVTGTGGTPTGSVTFKDSASTIGSGVLNGSGVATLAIASLPAGARSITAVYAGDGTFVGSTSSAVTQTVNQAVLTVTATGVLVYGNDTTNAVYTPFYTGLTNSDTTNVISGKATFSTDAAGTSYIGSNYITHVVDMGTLSAANYSFVAGPDGALAVTNRPLSVTNVLANAKDYDGTATATLNSAGAGLSGLVNGDEASVTLDASAATGLFNNKNAGIGKAVQVSGMTTAGDLGTNYYVIQPATAATISQTNITVTAAANSKTYDGTTNAASIPTITAGSMQPGDTANFTETYGTRNVGTGKTLTPAGSVADGNGGANYAVTFANDITGEIIAKPITVTAVTGTKMYDGGTTSTGVPTVSPSLVAGDTANFTQAFANKNAGTAKTLVPAGSVTDGNGGANYAVTFANDTTGEITTKPITVTAVTGTKMYDGGTTSAGVPTVTPGVASGDTANFTQGYDTKNVGTGKTLTPAGSVTDDNGGANYAVTFANNTTGEITAKPITVTAVTGTKVYDGGTTSAGVPTVTPGVASGDTANFTQSYDTKNVGTGKTLTPTGSVTDGNSGANYAVTFANDTTGEITTKPITVTAVTGTKMYDGGTTSAGVPTVTPGVASGDTANFTQSYDTKNVGTGKTLTPAGSVTDGNSGANYAVTFANDTTGEITTKPITVTAATGTKVYDGGTSSTAVPTVAPGVAAGDTANFSETYDTANIGTGKTLTPAGSVTDGNGGANYAVTFANDTTGVITGAASTAALISSANPSTNGDSVTFTATISSGAGTPTGDVVFKANAVPFSTNTLASGVASASTAALAVGTNTVTVEYAAQANWLGSSNSLDQVVKTSVVYSQTNLLLSISDNSNGTYTLSLQGTPGASYYIVTSGDVLAPMTGWSSVTGSTNTAPGPDGLWSFTVSNAAPAFYRSAAVNPAP